MPEDQPEVCFQRTDPAAAVPVCDSQILSDNSETALKARWDAVRKKEVDRAGDLPVWQLHASSRLLSETKGPGDCASGMNLPEADTVYAKNWTGMPCTHIPVHSS